MIMRIAELVIANNKEDRQEMIAPSLNVPILPSIDMMGEPDKAPVIDPSVNTATINPNFDDYHQHPPTTLSMKNVQSYRYNHPDPPVRA